MRVLRRQAYQAHAVPKTAGYPKGPFSAEILAAPVVSREEVLDDNPFPPGATAQNQFRGIKHYRCRMCHEVLLEEQLDGHICEVDDGED